MLIRSRALRPRLPRRRLLRRAALAAFAGPFLVAAVCTDRAPEPPSDAPEAGADPGAEPESAGGVPEPDTPSSWAYTCPGGPRFTVHYREGEARIELSDRGLSLPSVPAASGARYQAGSQLFWDRAGEAVLEVGGERSEGCSGRPAESPEDAARLLGFDFRGLGQEPGWLVDVDEDREVRWVGDYGEVRFATTAPDVARPEDGVVVWSSGADERPIRIRAEVEPCRDAMSGQRFSHTVRVTVDGSEYLGCGRWLGDG